MAKATTCKDALAKWAAGPGGGVALEAAEKVDLYGMQVRRLRGQP